MLVMNALVLETNALKMLAHTSAPHNQQLSNRTFTIATHRYSPSKTGGRYHTLVVTSKHATPTSDIYAIAFSVGLNGLQVD